jgi:DNA (cytosine-5)-methyltransferase 1
VLAHHYPAVPNYGDMTKHKEWDLGAIDLLVGGTPCQSFSVAGLRKGLDDPRGNLMLTYLAIADQRRPRWLVWENVPGVLSSNGGKDFGTFLGALAELGYGFAYRVLDAQFFGVAQRRRRVFVVGYLGDWRPAAAVLFEPESLRGDTAPSREAGQVAAPTIAGCSNGGGANGPGRDVDSCESLQVMTFDRQAQSQWGTEKVASSVMARDYKSATDLVAQPFQQTADCLTAAYGTKWNGNASAANGSLFAAQPISYGIPGNWIGRAPENGGNSTQFMEEVAPCLTGADKHGVAQPIGLDEEQNAMVDAFGTLKARTAGGGFEGTVMQSNMAVRRLTPVECERLQGFPDEYTNIPWRKADQSPDGPRYKALGNSMAVPVMHWIGRRISVYEDVMGKT